jgi:TPR repeat protein
MRFVLVVSLLLTALAGAARADFVNALTAYDAGAYGIAVTEWRRLAEHGDVESQVALAGMYEAGLGVAKDHRKAAHWYRRAARRGHTIARLNLGDMYSRGRGVTRDLVRAWYWLSLAAARGSDWARARREAVATRMTGKQLAQGRAMLKDRKAGR